MINPNPNFKEKKMGKSLKEVDTMIEEIVAERKKWEEIVYLYKKIEEDISLLEKINKELEELNRTEIKI